MPEEVLSTRTSAPQTRPLIRRTPFGAGAGRAAAGKGPVQGKKERNQGQKGRPDAWYAGTDAELAKRLPGSDWRARVGTAGTFAEQRRKSPIVELSQILVRECLGLKYRLRISDDFNYMCGLSLTKSKFRGLFL